MEDRESTPPSGTGHESRDQDRGRGPGSHRTARRARSAGQDGAGAKVSLYWHSALPQGFERERLEDLSRSVVEAAAGFPGPHESVLGELGEIEVNLVDDATIAAVHRDFLGDPTPTDVITFPHGEVFISVETAAGAGPAEGNSPGREAALYLVHAVLHLHGHQDSDPDERAAMARCQEGILESLWPGGGGG